MNHTNQIINIREPIPIKNVLICKIKLKTTHGYYNKTDKTNSKPS